MNSWISGGGPENEIVLSSRIRLARNLCNVPFPALLSAEGAQHIVETVKWAAENSSSKPTKFYKLKEMSQLDKQILVERHLISPDLVKNSAKAAAVISEDEILSVMINEEDHIRIQAILPGYQVDKVWKLINSIDDELESKLEFAYDEKWGYLTSCPTNVGTGLRASVMMHLPALNLTGSMAHITHAVTQIGMTIRGFYGEGTEIIGNIFQISNQITLGRSEEEIIDNLNAITRQIIEKEKEARNIILANNRIQIEDKVWRAWGIMKNARRMPSVECMNLLSDIRLGIGLGILPEIPASRLNETMVEIQPAHIQKRSGGELTPDNRDILRAQIIREKL